MRTIQAGSPLSAVALMIAALGLGACGGSDSPPAKHRIAGTVSGLAGSGLTLQAAPGGSIAIPANGTFVVATELAQGTPYSITVAQQPTSPWQTCTLSGGSGTVGSADVTVTVTCTTNTYAVGGTVDGLVTGGTLVLRNNGAADLTVTANGAFTFPALASGAAYEITVASKPDAQTCVVVGGAGTVEGAPVADVAVSCTTDVFRVGGTVTGLAGAGTLVLQDNGADDLVVLVNGAFEFATSVASGAAYDVTVLSAPAFQTCTVTRGAGTVGTAPVTDVLVTCTTNDYAVGGTVSGLAGTGLQLALSGAASETLPVAANGPFAFTTRLAYDAAYAVTVAAQPSAPTQTCTVAGGTGVVGAGDVTSVAVTCATNSYAVRGTVSGLAGTGLQLSLTSGDTGETVTVAPAAPEFAFQALLASGASYTVAVAAQPTSPSQLCAIAEPTGTIGSADASVAVTCTTSTYAIGGTVTGLNGSLVLRNNGADDLTVTGDGSFTFATKVASGAAYAVTIKAGSVTPAALGCTVTDGTGTVAGADVASVVVTCTTAIQRWDAPTTWGAVWQDDGHMVQHAVFGTTNGTDTVIDEQFPITWSLVNGPLGPPKRLDAFPAGARYGAGPFNGPRYQATAGSQVADIPGDMLVCAIVKPDFDPTWSADGKEKAIIANGLGTGTTSIAGGGWVLMQMHSMFHFHYQWRDTNGTHLGTAYTPTYFADQRKPDTGPLNPSYVVVCGGRNGNQIVAAANSFPDSNVFPATLTGTGPITLDTSVDHPLTIGGYDNGSADHVFPGRVYETAVWNEPATAANITAKFAAFQGLALQGGGTARYTRNREGPWIGTDGAYHTTWRHGPRIDPAKGVLFGLQGWNRLSYCAAIDGTRMACDDPSLTERFVYAPGESLDLWTVAGGATVLKDQLAPPGDAERPTADRVSLPKSASISIPLGAFDSAGPVHGQLWIRVAATTSGTIRVRTSNPVAAGTSQHDIALGTLTPNTWTRIWLNGLTTDGAAGTLSLEAPGTNAGTVTAYVWGVDLTQISGGGDLGAFDPGVAMYDWSTTIGRSGDGVVERPEYDVDVLELPAVPASTAASGFCLSADAQPFDGLAWDAGFVGPRGLLSWVNQANTAAAQLFVQGTAAGGSTRAICFYASGASGSACARPPAAWSAGSKHNVKGCLSASGAMRLYLDDVQAGTTITGVPVPELSGGRLCVGNGICAASAAWSISHPVPWNGYVSRALACRDLGPGASPSSCR